MKLNKDEGLDYLFNYSEGKITQGLGIDTILDDNWRYKQGEFNIILGLDNVGKTAWTMWYLTALNIQKKVVHLEWRKQRRTIEA